MDSHRDEPIQMEQTYGLAKLGPIEGPASWTCCDGGIVIMRLDTTNLAKNHLSELSRLRSSNRPHVFRLRNKTISGTVIGFEQHSGAVTLHVETR